MPSRMRALLVLNGFGLLLLAVLIGWVWFFALLHAVVLKAIANVQHTQALGSARVAVHEPVVGIQRHDQALLDRLPQQLRRGIRGLLQQAGQGVLARALQSGQVDHRLE